MWVMPRGVRSDDEVLSFPKMHPVLIGIRHEQHLMDKQV